MAHEQGYCSVEDVKALVARRTEYSDSTTPTEGQVSEFVQQIAGEIDTCLRVRGVATPVVEPDSFLESLKKLNATGAAAMAESAAMLQGARQTEGQTVGARLQAMYDKGLKAIKDGSAVDPAAALLGQSHMLARSRRTDSPSAVEEHDLPRFGIRKVF